MSAPTSPTEHATTLPQPPAQSSQTCTTDELRQDGKLWYKLHVFIYDLRKFRSHENSRERLDCVIDTYYIRPPYFSPTEAGKILRTIVDGDRILKEILNDFFAQKLEERMQSRMKETADYRVCAAHDLAPIMENAFCVHPKDLEKNKGLIKLLRTGGLGALDDGGVWKRLGKR